MRNLPKTAGGKENTEKPKDEKKEQTSQVEKSVLNTKKRTEDKNEGSDPPVQDVQK